MRALSGLLLAFILLTIAATARTEYVYSSGGCGNGGPGWWSVVTYENGIATGVHGVDCFGFYYHRDLCNGSTAPPAGDPFGGLTPNARGICEAGTWSALVSYDASHIVTGAVGIDCSGRTWSATACPAATTRQSEIRGRRKDAPATPGGQRLQ